jgi:putative ABC transport system ATP-binding protein
MTSSVIRLENVKKTYLLGGDQVNALDGVSLEIKSGEYVSIIGPSGSGKSTLMHIIGLLDRPTSGKVYLEGKDVSTLKQEELATLRSTHIGFVFQSFNLLARTTAIDNVELPLIYTGTGRMERFTMAKEALESVGLGERLNHTSAQLSGGQQQRVAIARALINNPSLILADEPTGNLDTKAGEDILKLLTDLNKKGHTVVVVTHDHDIADHAKRKISIRDGLISGDIKLRK